MQTLLLVDDEPNIVEGLASQFEGRYGGDVIVLKSFSGLHALSILQNNKVDVVLSDIRMPDMDGLTLQRETEALWPHIHFVFLSGFDDFQFIHQASKSPLYHGYLLKMEGDEVVLNKIDQEIAQCAAEARAELEQGEMQRRYARMQGFLQRAALEGFVRGGGSWQQIQHSLPNLEMTLDPTRPVAMVLGKDTAAEATEHLQSLMLADNILAAQFPQLVFESLMPESGTFVWLLQGAAPENPPATNYLYAVFEALQQQLSDTANCPVSVVVGNAGPFENLAEQVQPAEPHLPHGGPERWPPADRGRKYLRGSAAGHRQRFHPEPIPVFGTVAAVGPADAHRHCGYCIHHDADNIF